MRRFGRITPRIPGFPVVSRRIVWIAPALPHAEPGKTLPVMPHDASHRNVAKVAKTFGSAAFGSPLAESLGDFRHRDVGWAFIDNHVVAR